jgi:putative transposase
MPLTPAFTITLSSEQQAALEGLVRAHGTPQQLALRARIVLLGGSGTGVRATARELGIEPRTVRHWRQRWLSGTGEATERLADAPRSGAPASFTAEQVCAIVALACEPPSASGRPLSHWSQSELAREALRRGVATRISQRSVGRMLKRSRPQAASGASLAHAQARS